jgi:hypothetical protein
VNIYRFLDYRHHYPALLLPAGFEKRKNCDSLSLQSLFSRCGGFLGKGTEKDCPESINLGAKKT